ncbi:PREDICTED: myb-like protein X [Trachymyrmex cornetzi]|uniref:myb-like protein X n=1 Tax=Trachymyrmex cornetzi TaxID=471704 RepID=UPI00084F4DA0|nr:PREDICTED: myb-like protein X [Trachymyrmex cornetzi]
MTEVLRIAGSSSNLKGTFQKSLKIAAASSMGIFEIMKERANLSKEDAKSEEAVGEAEAYRLELQALKKKERQDKKDKTPSPREKDREKSNRGKRSSDITKKSPRRTPSDKIKARDKLITSESEHMDVDEKSPKSKKVTLDNPEKCPEEGNKERADQKLAVKEGKVEGYKNRRSETGFDTTELEDMIRRIVAEELSKYNRKPIITEI